MAVELSEATQERVRSLFDGQDLAQARDLLIDECADNLPFCEEATPTSSERIRFAVLKMSAGDLDRLVDAIALAQVDWRDVLVAAGFGDDPQAHNDWWPS